ncbi:WD repeat-containing protein 37, partial [Caligus rogercresseyi]
MDGGLFGGGGGGCSGGGVPSPQGSESWGERVREPLHGEREPSSQSLGVGAGHGAQNTEEPEDRNNVLKSFTKNTASKTRHKLKAKIVSSFKTPSVSCSLVGKFRAHGTDSGTWTSARRFMVPRTSLERHP